MHDPVWLHMDLDAFFASVEQVDNPSLRGKPVIVGGVPGDKRAVVATASYEARKYGVHSAMPLVRAIELCPNGVFLRGNYKRYGEISRRIMDILREFSPDVLQMSIDEAFVDLTGTERLFGAPEEVAEKIRARVREETGLTVSIGIAGTMYAAKMASGYKKPNGLTYIRRGGEGVFVRSLPLEKLWGVGEKTRARLRGAGLFTPEEIYQKPESLLESLVGHALGQFLYDAVRGGAGIRFDERAKNRSLSTERTFGDDLTDGYMIETVIMDMSHQIFRRMESKRLKSKTVFIKIRYSDFKTISAQATTPHCIGSAEDIFEQCRALFHKRYQKGRGIRLLGIGISAMEEGEAVQQDLYDAKSQKQAKIEKAIYALEQNNPAIKIRKARLLLEDGPDVRPRRAPPE